MQACVSYGTSPILKEIVQARFFLGTFRAAYVWFGHLDGMPAAECFYLHPPAKAEKPFLDGALQNQVWAAIGKQNSRYGTVGTVRRPPRRRVRVSLDQSALLLGAAPMIIFIVELAFVAGWCLHRGIV